MPTQVVVTVADDGVGMPPQGMPPGHFGLRGLAERVAHLGGFFEVGAQRSARGAPERTDSVGANAMISVLLVDDHAVVRMGFRLLLQSQPEISVIAEAESGEAACQRYLELQPDVVVMDLAMPGMGGLEALRRIRAHHPQARVLTLSAQDDPMHARRALREGALGFSLQAQRA